MLGMYFIHRDEKKYWNKSFTGNAFTHKPFLEVSEKNFK